MGLLCGIGGAIIIASPMIAIYQYTPIESRGGAVSSLLIPAILIFALLGNLVGGCGRGNRRCEMGGPTFDAHARRDNFLAVFRVVLNERFEFTPSRLRLC